MNKYNKYLPSNFNNLSEEDQHDIVQFLDSLNELELQACLIAKTHLDTSFNILKCNGFVCWKKNKNQN